jgi:hypothetical protein
MIRKALIPLCNASLRRSTGNGSKEDYHFQVSTAAHDKHKKAILTCKKQIVFLQFMISVSAILYLYMLKLANFCGVSRHFAFFAHSVQLSISVIFHFVTL